MAHQEKRKYLLDLEKLKLQGVRLTKDYTMSDSLADIRFEYESHRSNYDVVDSVNFMKDILGFSFTLIEALNHRFGPILQLRGWSAYMKNHMGRFDRLLERAYHRFWRQGQPSPFMEFGFLVFGSMIMWHLQNKYMNGLPVTEMLGVMGDGSAPTAARPAARPPAPNSNAPEGGAGSQVVGNIMRFLTGGNANRPLPAHATQSQPQPTIIPGAAPPQPTVAHIPTMAHIPTTSAPVPPSGRAATLPPLNVRGMPPPRRTLRRPSHHLRDDNAARPPLSPVQESAQEHTIPEPP